MNISATCTETLLWIYKTVNKIGLFDKKIIQAIYILSYFTYKRYLEDPYAKLIKHHAKLFENGHILDIGANIGYTSYIFSKVINNTYKVIAFEPEARNFKILQHVSNKYGFAKRLLAIKAAVGDKEESIELWKNAANNSDHRILTPALKNALTHTMNVQITDVITIDNYLRSIDAEYPISFIKIDVQGYELAVCQGMTETLIRNPQAVIGFEYCPDILKSLGFDPVLLLQFFKDKGYLFFRLNKKNLLEKCDITNLNMKSQEYVELLCSKNNLCNA